MLPSDFVCGCQWFLDSLPRQPESVPRIVVTVMVENREISALVDTGANQCILNWEIAQDLVAPAEERRPQVRALGGNLHVGALFPVTIDFPADEGTAVTFETLAWSAPTFHGPNLIGYGGVLERMRIALDPATNRFFFGAG